MAAITLVGGGVILIGFVVWRANWNAYMFGPRWSIVFLPLLLFWAGAWLRKKHHPIIWCMAVLLLTYSIGVSLIGTTAPFINAPGRYTAAAALRQMMHPESPTLERPIIASN